METTTQSRSTQADLIDRVVAWHNRHPLTSRITASQVSGIGVVALPLALKGSKGRTKPLFDEVFIAPLKLRAIADFAQRHGSIRRPGQADWPQRNIPTSKAHATTPAETRFVLTAAIESGSRRIRVLIGDGATPRLIGPRFWNRRRLRGSLSASVSLVGMLAIGSTIWPVSGDDTAAHTDQFDSGVVVFAAASQPATPASAVPLVDNAAIASGAPPMAVASQPTLSSETPVAAAEASASAAAIAEIKPAQSEPPGEKPAPVAEPAVPQTRQANHSPPPANELPIVATAHPADSAKQARSESKEVFAVATESTASRAASHLRMALLDAPTEPHPDHPHAEVMRVGARWRVVIWPLDDRAAADSLRRALADRGVKGEVISF